MTNNEGELAERSSSSDTDDWCPYCGAEGLDDKSEHVEDTHFDGTAGA